MATAALGAAAIAGRFVFTTGDRAPNLIEEQCLETTS
jgi:hypothetical protein